MGKWIFLLLLICSSGVNASSCSYTDESLSKWMMEYFRNPKREILPCSLSYYANSSIFREHKNGRMPTAYFFASAFDGSGLETLFESVSRKTSLNEKMFVLDVFWVKNSEISRDLISRAGESWPEPEIA